MMAEDKGSSGGTFLLKKSSKTPPFFTSQQPPWREFPPRSEPERSSPRNFTERPSISPWMLTQPTKESFDSTFPPPPPFPTPMPSESTKPQTIRELTGVYNWAEDAQIIEFFKNKSQFQREKTLELEKTKFTKELGRPYEALRDRFKRYLRFVRADELEKIKAIVEDDPPEQHFLHFDKIPDDLDRDRKQFREVSRVEPPGSPSLSVLVKRTVRGKAKDSRSKVDDGQPKKKRGRKPKADKLREEIKQEDGPGEDAPAVLQSSPVRRRKRSPSLREQKSAGEKGRNGGRASDEPESFPIHRYIPEQYFSSGGGLRLKSLPISAQCLAEVAKLEQASAGNLDRIQLITDGKEVTFLFAEDAAKERVVLEALGKLHGLSKEEVAERYEGVSNDLQDLRAYLQGNLQVFWTRLEDDMLIRASHDNALLRMVTNHKGEASVNRRIEFLRRRNLL
eukprot:TRINITY_DN2033_c0_g2_i3.p1 TRINITY_DN2033_c0_g2~~TRINITY_DN2033_c0_g2_i3.p1  ORF type:complete len:450 (-),score=82.19 TRINITY_DN2033_c0_g2_i3:69-1418(-)